MSTIIEFLERLSGLVIGVLWFAVSIFTSILIWLIIRPKCPTCGNENLEDYTNLGYGVYCPICNKYIH